VLECRHLQEHCCFHLQVESSTSHVNIKRKLDATVLMLRKASTLRASLPHAPPRIGQQLAGATATLVVRTSQLAHALG
jgi:hypothetical protein